MSMRTAARDNPVRTAGGITGAVLALLVSLADWGLESIPASVPGEVRTAAYGLVVLAAALIAERVGKWVQGRFTEPKGALDELIRAREGEPSKGTAYERARGRNETDPHGPDLEDGEL